MKIRTLMLLSLMLSACNDKQAMYIDLGSQCNNGVEGIRYFDIQQGDPRMNYFVGRTICDYDEAGRVISEKFYDSINFDARITVETNYYWTETEVMIEVKDYMTGDYRKDFVSSRRVVDLM